MLGAAVVGVAATAAFATPALAWHVVVSGTSACEKSTGQWLVAWTVENPESSTGTFTQVTTTPSAPIAGDAIRVNGTVASHHSVTGTQHFDAVVTSANLTVKVEWPQDRDQPAFSRTVTFSGVCVKETTPPTTEVPPVVPPVVPREATPSASPAPLPVTGTKVGLYGGASLLLLGAGGALFLVARRRRIKFTA